MAEPKQIILHPTLTDGTLDMDTNLYPKTRESDIIPDFNTYQRPLSAGTGVQIRNTEDQTSSVISVNLESENLKAILLDLCYPTGSVYISSRNDTICPIQQQLGGVWEQLEGGRTLVSAGDLSIAGEVKHTFTVKEIGGKPDWQLIQHTHNLAADLINNTKDPNAEDPDKSGLYGVFRVPSTSQNYSNIIFTDTTATDKNQIITCDTYSNGTTSGTLAGTMTLENAYSGGDHAVYRTYIDANHEHTLKYNHTENVISDITTLNVEDTSLSNYSPYYVVKIWYRTR